MDPNLGCRNKALAQKGEKEKGDQRESHMGWASTQGK
jgi:hypothetical protein